MGSTTVTDMAIPKVIYQTFKTNKLPLINKIAVRWLKFRNKDYQYEFYDDNRIVQFLKEAYEPEILQAYERLNIGAAKADFFRYAILYKKGGVYLDIDAYALGSFDQIVRPDDAAVISKEKFPNIYVQWALIFEAGHPFLKKTLDLIMYNIRENTYPHSVHGMTGPTAYSQALLECIAADPQVKYRIFGQDYNKKIKPRLPFSKMLYKDSQHWKKMEKTTTVLKPL